MKVNIFLVPVLVLLVSACGLAAKTSPTPTPMPTVDPNYLRSDPIPEQVAYQNETFLPLDLKGFLFYQNTLVNSRTLTLDATSSEYLAAEIHSGILSVEIINTNWYGTENVPVTACDEAGICIQLSVSYSRVNESAAEHVRVIYVGNSGFMIMSGGKKVLIDGMYGGNPQAAKALYANSTPPFDNIDLILASHMDGDHFDPNQIKTYMLRNPNTVFISTSQSTTQISGLDERVIEMDPALAGSPQMEEVNGIQVEALYLSHGTVPEGMEEHYNNGYVVTIGDLTFFHTGDIGGTEDMLALNLDDKGIDLAFIVHFYMRSARDKNAFDNRIAAAYHFPIHYEGTTPAFSASVTQRAFPDAVIFTSVLQSWIMP